jgi:hypothetical protein
MCDCPIKLTFSPEEFYAMQVYMQRGMDEEDKQGDERHRFRGAAEKLLTDCKRFCGAYGPA